jgi:protein TonB
MATILAGLVLLFAYPAHPVHPVPVAAAHAPLVPVPAAPAPAAPAPAAPATAALAPPGAKIAAVRLIYRKDPVLPASARQLIAKGQMSPSSRVLAEATIGPDGRVVGVKVISGHPILAKAARDAVMQWRYKPALFDGQPVASTTQIALNFARSR